MLDSRLPKPKITAERCDRVKDVPELGITKDLKMS